MRTDLIKEGAPQYKANLHSHSNISDGKLSPAEMAQAYYEHGYSILCISDHEICVEHSDLNRPDFLLLTGYEYAITQRGDVSFKRRKTTHLNFWAKEPGNTTHVCFNPENMKLVKDQSRIAECAYVGTPDYERVYSVEKTNEVIQAAVDNGYLVGYNHPQWSLHDRTDYIGLQNLTSMEIMNYDCVQDGIHEFSAGVYDEMLRAGQRIGCVATDDNHNIHPMDDPLCDSFGGFAMILAKELTYPAVIEAMEKKEFYASAGPEIYALYVEDGVVHIRCSGVRSVRLTTFGRRSSAVIAARGETLQEAQFPLKPEDGFFRIEITDWEGQSANTRGYFLDELQGL